MSTCYSPLRVVKDSKNNLIFTNQGKPSIPCGQCRGCRLNHAEGWAIRMVHEASLHDENSFLTLTYDDTNLPVNGNLDYRAVTNFIKRLRKALAPTSYNKKIKYYLVGEYGKKFSRPHYHIILFGFDFSSPDIHYKGRDNVRTLDDKIEQNPKQPYYVSTFLDDLWGLGRCNLSHVTYDTCMYVAKYVTKKISGKNKDAHYQKINELGEIISVVPEKSQMSRKNAIGKEWLEKFWTDIYPDDFAVHEAKKLKTPKYYDKWLEKNDPDLYEHIKKAREFSAPKYNQTDATRIHETKHLISKNYSSRLEGPAPTNDIDEKILNYNKDEIIRLHKRKKNAT